MKPDYYEARVAEVEDLLRNQHYRGCICVSGKVFEEALQDLWGTYVTTMEESADREEIAAAESRCEAAGAASNKSSLSGLVRLYQEGDVFNKLRRQVKPNLGQLSFLNWDRIIALDDEARYSADNQQFDQVDAEQVFFWMKAFLQELQLAQPRPASPSVPVEEAGLPPACPECKTPLQHGWGFCPKCGTCIFLVCAKCHRTLKPNFRICPYCETPVRGLGGVLTNGMLEYELLCRGVYLDLKVTPRERIMLERRRLELGLTTEQAEALERHCVQANVLEYQHLLEVAYANGEVDEKERRFLEKKREQLKIEPDVSAIIEENVREMFKEQS